MKILLLQIGDKLNDLMEKVPFIREVITGGLAFLGKLFGALFLLLIGRWIARMLEKGTKRLFERIGIDKLAERLGDIDMFSNANMKIVPSVLFSKAVYYLVFFIFIWISTDVLGVKALSDMIAKIFDYLPTLVSALVVFLAGIILADFLKKIVLTATKSLNIPAGSLIANFVFYFLFINVAMITLSQAGIDTESIESNISIILGGIVAAFAIGYGFASRPLLANLLASYYNRNKVKIGDRLKLGEIEGEVTKIDNTTFTLESREGRRTIVPISKLMEEPYEFVD